MQNCPSDLYHIKPLMVDVIVYKPSPYGLVFIYMINPLSYALGFIIYHTKHERVYVSYILYTYISYTKI